MKTYEKLDFPTKTMWNIGIEYFISNGNTRNYAQEISKTPGYLILHSSSSQ